MCRDCSKLVDGVGVETRVRGGYIMYIERVEHNEHTARWSLVSTSTNGYGASTLTTTEPELCLCRDLTTQLNPVVLTSNFCLAFIDIPTILMLVQDEPGGLPPGAPPTRK